MIPVYFMVHLFLVLYSNHYQKKKRFLNIFKMNRNKLLRLIFPKYNALTKWFFDINLNKQDNFCSSY